MSNQCCCQIYTGWHIQFEALVARSSPPIFSQLNNLGAPRRRVITSQLKQIKRYYVKSSLIFVADCVIFFMEMALARLFRDLDWIIRVLADITGTRDCAEWMRDIRTLWVLSTHALRGDLRWFVCGIESKISWIEVCSMLSWLLDESDHVCSCGPQTFDSSENSFSLRGTTPYRLAIWDFPSVSSLKTKATVLLWEIALIPYFAFCQFLLLLRHFAVKSICKINRN